MGIKQLVQYAVTVNRSLAARDGGPSFFDAEAYAAWNEGLAEVLDAILGELSESCQHMPSKSLSLGRGIKSLAVSVRTMTTSPDASAYVRRIEAILAELMGLVRE